MKESKIQWTDATYNPWHGCTKVSPGCKFCYMYRDKIKYGQDPTKIVRSKTMFNAPLKWREPKLIFTCSWSDWFHEEADQWRDEAWEIIKQCPQHQFQICTKRPERIMDHLPSDWGKGYPNVWLGTTVENQDYVSRIEILKKIPAKIRFISFEPLIGEIKTDYISKKIHWIILGGESGNDNGKYRYRPSKIKWYENIIKGYHSKSPDTKVFVKQMGTYISKELEMSDRHGSQMNDFPKSLQIREFPKY